MNSKLFILGAALAACGFAHGAEIHIKRQCECTGALVTLSDVAEIYASSEAEKSQLESVELFPAPITGQSRLVRSREIQDVLAQRGVDLRRNRIAGSSTVKVTTAKPQSPVVEIVESTVIQSKPVAQMEVVVPLRAIARGRVVQASDVKLQSVAETSANGNTIGDVSRVVGYETVRDLPVGRPLRASDIRSPILVTRNSIVTVFARTQGIQVRTAAKAMEDGARDDLIKLQSQLDRDEVFIARVVGHKEVEVFAGPPLIQSPVETRQPREVEKIDREATNKGPSLFGLRVQTSE